MDRTTASYEMQYVLAKAVNGAKLVAIESKSFSLNLDERTSNNKKRVLGILVSYYSPVKNFLAFYSLTSLQKPSGNLLV